MSIIELQKSIEGRSTVEKICRVRNYYTNDQSIDHLWRGSKDVEVFTLLSIDVFGEINKRQSFYLSVYHSANDRDDEAIAWYRRQKESGCHVIRINGLGEVNRI